MQTVIRSYASIYNKIDESAVNPVHWNYTGVFILEDHTTLNVINIVSITRKANFATSYGEEMYVRVQLQNSIYKQLLKANRKNIRFQLIRTPTTKLGTLAKVHNGYIEEYSVFLTESRSEAIETRKGEVTGTHIDDLGALIDTHIQLVEKGLMEYRLWEIGGTYRNVKPDNFIRGLLTHNGFSVDVAEPDSKEIYYQLVVPNGVTLPEIPKWLQGNKGVYATGIACYCQKKIWYIFPPYDVKRYQTSKKRLSIINIPKNEMLGITNSYVEEDMELYIMATGDTMHIDETEHHMDSTGSGIKVAKAGNLIKGFSESSNGETTIPKGRNMVTIDFDDRPGLPGKLKPNPKLTSANMWEDASNVTKNLGNVIQLTWEASNPTLLIPGMPTKLYYRDAKKTYNLYGTLLAAETHVTTALQSTTDTRYVSVTVLTLYTERATR